MRSRLASCNKGRREGTDGGDKESFDGVGQHRETSVVRLRKEELENKSMLNNFAGETQQVFYLESGIVLFSGWYIYWKKRNMKIFSKTKKTNQQEDF